MGYFRLLLAYAVVASHIGISAGAFDVGEIAVVSFFLLSGYVITALIDRHYPDLRAIGLFYLDRALRLYPQFLFYSLATIIAVEAFGLRHQWLSSPPSLSSDLAQLTMAPLNFAERFPNMLLPQGWSLGLEMTFYAVFPLVLIPDKRPPVAYVSAVIFGCAYCGKLPPDWFAYRLLPGILFVFALGSWIRRPEPIRGRWLIGGGFALAAAALLVALTIWPRRTSVCDVLIGLVVGVPVMTALARAKVAGALGHARRQSQLWRVPQPHPAAGDDQAAPARRFARPRVRPADPGERGLELSHLPLDRNAGHRAATRLAGEAVG